MNAQPNFRLRDLLELLSAYTLILAAIWTPFPVQRVFDWLAIVMIVGVTVLRREKLQALGLAPAETLRPFWIVAAAMLLACLALIAAKQLGTLHALPVIGHLSTRTRVIGYVIWSFVQEFLIQVFMLTRLMSLLRRPSLAIAVTALLFAVAHIPNPVLIWLTLLWACIACPLFLRYRNLYVLGIAHGILGLCVAVTVPDAMHHHMRVGLGYLRYQPQHRLIQRSKAPQTVSTQAWVMEDAAIRRSERHARP